MLGLDLEHDRLLDLVQGLEKPEQSLGPDDAVTHGLLTPTISVEVVEHVEMIVVEQQVGIGFECCEGLLIVAGCVEGGQNIRFDRQIGVLECGDERAGAEDGTMIGHHLGREKVEIGTVIRMRGNLFQDEGVVLGLELCHPCLHILVRALGPFRDEILAVVVQGFDEVESGPHLWDIGCSPHRLDDLELGVLDHDLMIQSSKDLVEVCEVPEETLDLMEADGDRLVPPRTSWNDFVEKRSMIEDEKVIMVLVDEIQDGSNVQILAVLVLTFRSDSRVECSEKYIRHKFPQSPVLGEICRAEGPLERLRRFVSFRLSCRFQPRGDRTICGVISDNTTQPGAVHYPIG